MTMTSNIPAMAKAKGWRREELAANAKISYRTASRMMDGDTYFGTRAMEKVCIALNCQPNDLLKVHKHEG